MTPKANDKKTSPEDWHPAKVVAELRLGGYSLRQLALNNGYSNPNSITKALRNPYPLAEAIIAEALGREPKEIWPSRYTDNGAPNRGKPGPRVGWPEGAKPSSHRTQKVA